MKELDVMKFFEQGFLADYYSYAEPLTDAPKEFHIATGLSVLATAIGRTVFLQLGDKQLFPNIWALVLAPSSAYRKSSSMQIGLNLLYELDSSLILPNEFSIEAFLEHLSQHPQGILAYSEFSSLLEACQRSYMIGLKSTLTDLYDCRPWFIKKLKNANYKIENGCLSLIGASTIEWLITGMKEGDIKGGFLARFVYFPSSPKTKSLPIPPKSDANKKALLVEQLKTFRNIQGEMEITPEARECYEQWYVSHEKSLAGEVRPDLLSSFFNRLPDYCWKFAMLYAVSVDKSLKISGGAVSKSIILTEYLKTSIKRLIEEEFEFTKEGLNKKKVMRMIEDYFEKHKMAIEHSTLLRNSHIPAKELKDTITALYEEKRLLPDNGDGRYWPCG